VRHLSHLIPLGATFVAPNKFQIKIAGRIPPTFWEFILGATLSYLIWVLGATTSHPIGLGVFTLSPCLSSLSLHLLTISLSQPPPRRALSLLCSLSLAWPVTTTLQPPPPLPLSLSPGFAEPRWPDACLRPSASPGQLRASANPRAPDPNRAPQLSRRSRRGRSNLDDQPPPPLPLSHLVKWFDESRWGNLFSPNGFLKIRVFSF
jgi:hypothetical protein